MPSHPFHITIGASPSKGLSLEGDLRMVKAALLYADRVKLCSFVSSMMLTMVGLTESNQRQHLDMLEALIPAMSDDKELAAEQVRLLRTFRAIGHGKNPTRRELLQRAQIQGRLTKMRRDLQEITGRLLEKAGIESLTSAIETGLLELHTFRAGKTWDTEDMVKEFVEVISNAISSGSTYPLFDDQTGNLVRLGIQGKKIHVSESGIARGKHGGLAARLLEGLPVFEEASINEILDIKRELEKPLIRFRSAVIKFSEGIRTASWDEDFPSDAEEVVRRDIEPAVLEIKDATKSNKYLAALMRSLAEKPLVIPGGSGLGFLISQLSALPEIASQAFSLGTVAASGIIAYDAYQDWHKKQQEVEKNQLYFYYHTGELLVNRTYEYR